MQLLTHILEIKRVDKRCEILARFMLLSPRERKYAMQALHQSASLHQQGSGFEEFTLLELVQAICDVTEDDGEVVATVRHMLRSGELRLCGNFRGAPPEAFG
jgi:hypothetical protein